MKKTLLVSLLAIPFFLFSSAKSVFADSCNVSVTPNGGTSATTFTAQIRCTDPSNTSHTAQIRIASETPGNNPIQATSFTPTFYDWTTSGLQPNSSGSSQGYVVDVFDQFMTLIGTSNEFTITASAAIACCPVKPTDSNFCQVATGAGCGAVAANFTGCPSTCGPNAININSLCGGGDKWVCVDPNPGGCNSINGSTCPANSSVCNNNMSVCCSNTNHDALCKAVPNYTVTYSPLCNGDTGISTALGCIDFRGTQTISTLLSWGVSIGGGIAFVMILIAAIQINTSRGDAKRVAAARELLFSALAGVFLITISVVLLNFIGISVLGLDKFGFATQ